MSAIEVEVKVIGMFGAESIAVAARVTVPAGATVKDALEALHRTGAIDATVLAQTKALRPPHYLVINDQAVRSRALAKRLANGDVVTVMQIMAGG